MWPQLFGQRLTGLVERRLHPRNYGATSRPPPRAMDQYDGRKEPYSGEMRALVLRVRETSYGWLR